MNEVFYLVESNEMALIQEELSVDHGVGEEQFDYSHYRKVFASVTQ
jgi:hypothetical protein